MKNTSIEWCDHTFNAWEGCTKVSPGCANCYAEARNNRYHAGKNWGPGAPRMIRSDAYWKEPLKWNKEAADLDVQYKRGNFNPHVRPRVFCSSLADWLDEEGPIEQRVRLLKLIHDTPNLDWLLLSKRPQNWRDHVAAAMMSFEEDRRHPTVDEENNILAKCGKVSTKRFLEIIAPFKRADVSLWLGQWLEGTPPSNVWIGTTVEDQQRADERIPELLKIPAKVRFLSCEPLLGPVDLKPFMWSQSVGTCRHETRRSLGLQAIDWLIAGGESGPKARPMHPLWAVSLRDQCQAAGVAFHFKQWGGTRNKGGRYLEGREWNEFPEVEK